MEKKEKRKFNYNVVIIALCFMMVLFGLGLWGAKSLFVVPITEALHISRGAYSLVDTMRYAATAIVNIFFGYLVGKLGSKKLICAGFIALLGAALCYALASNVWVLYIGGILCACLVLFIVITLQFVIASAQKVKKQVMQPAE